MDVEIVLQATDAPSVLTAARAALLGGAARLAETIRCARGRIEVILAGSISPAIIGPLLASLPPTEGRISVHAYSGAQIAGLTTVDSVRALVDRVDQRRENS